MLSSGCDHYVDGQILIGGFLTDMERTAMTAKGLLTVVRRIRVSRRLKERRAARNRKTDAIVRPPILRQCEVLGDNRVGINCDPKKIVLAVPRKPRCTVIEFCAELEGELVLSDFELDRFVVRRNRIPEGWIGCILFFGKKYCTPDGRICYRALLLSEKECDWRFLPVTNRLPPNSKAAILIK